MANMKGFFNKKYSKYLLLLLAFAFVLSSVSGVIFMTNKYNVISIDNKKVSINEFIKILNSKRQIDYYSAKDKESINFLNSKEYMVNLLNNLLYDTIIYKNIYDLRLLPSDDFILSILINEPSFKTNDRFDLTKFESLINMYNLTQQGYIDLLKDQKSQEYLLSIFNNKINVNNIVNIIYSNNNKYKDVVIYKIKKNALNIEKTNFDDNKLKEYYDSNINDFKEEETKKVDYIVLNEDVDKNKIEELLLTSFDIKELANNLDTEVKTFGYLSRENILKNDKIKELVDYNINDFSNLKTDGNNYIIYSVVDIKEEKLKNFEDCKKDINDILNNEYMDTRSKEIVSDYVEKSNIFLLSKGFRKENVRINHKYNVYGSNFTNDILTTTENYSSVFTNEDYVFFAKIDKVGIIDKDDVNFVKKEDIEFKIKSSFSNDIHNAYLNYLNDYRYKVKVNYKLLDLIRNG